MKAIRNATQRVSLPLRPHLEELVDTHTHRFQLTATCSTVKLAAHLCVPFSRIRSTMFSSELATLRRLGLRHVSSLPSHCVALMSCTPGRRGRHWTPLTLSMSAKGALASAQLCHGSEHCTHDVERSERRLQHGESDRRRPQVSPPSSLSLVSGSLTSSRRRDSESMEPAIQVRQSPTACRGMGDGLVPILSD